LSADVESENINNHNSLSYGGSLYVNVRTKVAVHHLWACTRRGKVKLCYI